MVAFRKTGLALLALLALAAVAQADLGKASLSAQASHAEEGYEGHQEKPDGEHVELVPPESWTKEEIEAWKEKAKEDMEWTKEELDQWKKDNHIVDPPEHLPNVHPEKPEKSVEVIKEELDVEWHKPEGKPKPIPKPVFDFQPVEIPKPEKPEKPEKVEAVKDFTEKHGEKKKPEKPDFDFVPVEIPKPEKPEKPEKVEAIKDVTEKVPSAPLKYKTVFVPDYKKPEIPEHEDKVIVKVIPIKDITEKYDDLYKDQHQDSVEAWKEAKEGVEHSSAKESLEGWDHGKEYGGDHSFSSSFKPYNAEPKN